MSHKYTIARITKDDEHFEILVNPNRALDYRMGKNFSVNQIIITETIFSDANKGKKAAEEKILKVFGTINILQVADIILKKGKLQLTTEQRKKMIDNKRKQIIDFISRQCVDPKSNLPHPPLRIENALQQIRFSIDPFESVEEQAKDIIGKMRLILPLKMEKIIVNVSIPVEYAAKAYATVKKYSTILREEWQNNGYWVAIVEMPGGLEEEFYEKVNNICHGEVEAKVLKTK